MPGSPAHPPLGSGIVSLTGTPWIVLGRSDSPGKLRVLLSASRGGRHASQGKATSLLCCFLSVREAGGGGKPESGFVTQAFLAIRVFLLADVNVAFQQSAHKVLLDDDNLLPLLHLTIEYHGKEHKGLPFLLASFCSYWSSSVLLPVLPSTSTETLEIT